MPFGKSHSMSRPRAARRNDPPAALRGSPRRAPERLPRRAIAFALAAWLTFLIPGPALAHNGLVHQDMTDVAWEIMLAVSNPGHPGALAERPSNVPAAQWNAFVASIQAAVPKVRALPAGLPGPHKTACSDDVTTVPTQWASGKSLGDLAFAPGITYITGNDCGVRAKWAPGGVFDGINPAPPAGHRDHTGIALGFWANSIDDEYDDTHLWFRPTSAGGLGAIKKEANDLATAGFAIAVLPFVCLWDCLFGSCGSCGSDAKDLADTANPIDSVEGLIPGIGDISGANYTGVWHFINMRPGAPNDYDDRPGMLYETAGPDGSPDAVEIALMAIADASGWSIHYDKSLGPRRYTIRGANDGHPDSRARDTGQWQFSTFVHTSFEPVDNLAFYGWRRFREDSTHDAHNLAWPLHALGDATVPMHVSGTSGYGHRPYEDAQEFRWSAVRRLEDPAPSNAQWSPARQILLKAFEWRRFILNWRSAHPGHSRDVPVRALVTALAQKSFDYSRDRQAATGLWPYNSQASVLYLADPGSARNFYEHPAAIDQSRFLIESGIAAELAFLVSAAEAF